MKQSAHRILSRFHLPSWRRGECCIFKPDALGDLILATGAIQRLNRHFGAGNCTLITSKANHECAEYLFPHNPKINTGHSFGGRQHGEPLSSLFRVMPRLSRARFNTLVCLRHQRLPLHQAMLLTWIKAHRQFGVNSPQAPSWDRFREADISYPGPGTQRNGACLELEAHAAVLSQCTGVQFTGADLKPKLETMPGEGYLLFNPYGSEEKKQCPIPKWVEIVDAIERDIPGQICRVSCPPGKLLEARATFRSRVMPTASFREYLRVCRQGARRGDNRYGHGPPGHCHGQTQRCSYRRRSVRDVRPLEDKRATEVDPPRPALLPVPLALLSA